MSTPNKKKESSVEEKPSEAEREGPYEDVNPKLSAIDAPISEIHTKGLKTLKDAVKPKNKRKKKGSPMI